MVFPVRIITGNNVVSSPPRISIKDFTQFRRVIDVGVGRLRRLVERHVVQQVFSAHVDGVKTSYTVEKFRFQIFNTRRFYHIRNHTQCTSESVFVNLRVLRDQNKV